MSKVYVGSLDSRTTEEELEDAFRAFGVLRSVWVARKPPGYAFIEFDDRRDAEDAIRALDGKNGWRVELSRSRGSGGGGPRGGGGGSGRGRGGSDLKCYECGASGHFARECRAGTASGRSSRGRRRSPSPQYRRSSPEYGWSPSRRSRSPHRSSASPKRAHNYSKSPPPRHERDVSPHVNG
ncbi:hypothetical protein KI387_023605, partial [Taxus chinensis]